MKRAAFVASASGLLVPSAVRAAYVGNRRSIIFNSGNEAIADTAGNSISSGTTMTVTWDSGKAPGPGKMMIAVCQGTGANTVTNSNGWTFLDNPGNVGRNGSIPFALAWKASTGSDTSSMTWGLSSVSGNLSVVCAQFTNAQLTAPTWVQTTATNSPCIAGPILTNADKNIILIGVGAQGTVSTIPAPTGYTQKKFSAASYGAAIHISNTYLNGVITANTTATWSSGGTRMNNYIVVLPAIS